MAKKKNKEIKKVKPRKTLSKSEPQTMEELLKQTGYKISGLKKGEVIKGIVTEVSKNRVLIDIGAKTEGMVMGKEYDLAREMLENLKVGDEIEARVGMVENDSGQILLNLRQTIIDKRWVIFEELLETKKPLKVEGLEVNKGGIIVKTKGVRGFVPSSQFGREYLGKLDQLVDKRFSVKVIEVDRDKNRLIFSEKAISEKEALKEQEEALTKVKKGDELDGIVSGIMPFGVFVRVNIPLKKKKDKSEKDLFLEGLVHISEISWKKVSDPGNFYKTGDFIHVSVIGIDEESNRLNLSVKQLLPDPWEKVAKKYPEGSTVKGKITKLAPFGVFVNLMPGVDGLIHISKIPSDKEFKEGQSIECFVEKMDIKHRRLSLTLSLLKKPVGYK